MATSNPRVQVTVDPELATALAAVTPRPASKSRLIRDLALRGARAAEQEHSQQAEAQAYLLRIAEGEVEHDLDAVRASRESRDEHIR